MEDLKEIFGDVIYAYTRKDAIKDGVLIDVSDMARQAGYKPQTCITDGVHQLLKVPEDLKGMQDYCGRLWDVLYMGMHELRNHIKKGFTSTTVFFKVIIANPKPVMHELKIVLDGDGFTILLKSES